MQVIQLTPQQPNLKGLLTDDRALILCNTTGGGFVLSVPLGSGAIVRELLIKNIGIIDLVLSFDYNSQLFTTTGNVNLKTIYPDECFQMSNDTRTGLWYQTNNPSIYS